MCALRSPQESTVEDRRWSSNEKDAPRLWPGPRGCCVRASAPWLGGGRRLPDEQSPPSPGYDPHQDTRTEHGRVGGPCIGGGDAPGGADAGALAFAGQGRVNPGWARAALLLGVIGVLTVRGHYRLRISPRLSEEAAALFGAVAGVVLVVSALAPRPSLPGLLWAGGTGSVYLLAVHGAAYGLLRLLRRYGHLLEPTLIVGAGGVGVQVANVLLDHPEYGLPPLGFLDDGAEEDLPLPVLGPVRSLDLQVRRRGVRRVVVAFGVTPDPETV